jgi:hypothetical protein
MPNLEYVIRPYQSPVPFGTTVIPSTPSRGTERATLTWGATAQGTMPVPTEAPAAPNTPMRYQLQCCKEGLQENSRSTNRHRIIGSDGVSYVDIERPYQMQLKRNTKHDCGDSLDQISLVSQGVNAVLNDFSDQITEATAKFGAEDCNTQWNLSA